MSVPSEPFTRASMYLGPVLEAHGFRVVAREYAEGSEAAATAEYSRGPIRVRLVWEPVERAVFLEAARQSGGSVISRWVDVEWAVAGKRLPLEHDLDEARLERLAIALDTFLIPVRANEAD